MREPVCFGCGSRHRLTWHHVLPRALGGGDQPDNLVAVCQTCHAAVHYPGSLRARDRNPRLLKRLKRPGVARLRALIDLARARAVHASAIVAMVDTPATHYGAPEG